MALAKQLDGWAVADNGKVILYQLFIAIYIHIYIYMAVSQNIKPRSIPWTHRPIHTPDPYQNAGDPDRSIRLDHRGPIHTRILTQPHMYNIQYIYTIYNIYISSSIAQTPHILSCNHLSSIICAINRVPRIVHGPNCSMFFSACEKLVQRRNKVFLNLSHSSQRGLLDTEVPERASGIPFGRSVGSKEREHVRGTG